MSKQDSSGAKKIVIVGGGFAGLNAYLELHRRFHSKKGQVEITMISASDKFLFTPLLHEVATGTLSPDDILHPIRQLAETCLRFVQGRVQKIDTAGERVWYRDDDGKEEALEYDYLVLAAGAEIAYFGIPGAAEHTLCLKTYEDVKKLKNRIIEAFEEAQGLSAAEQKKRLRFVVVGGGPTGVEIVGEMADLFAGALKQEFPEQHQHAEIVLLEAADRVVCNMDTWFSRKVVDILEKKKNVRVMCGKRVSQVTPAGLEMGEEFMEAGTVVWVAGVRAKELPVEGVSLDRDEKSKRIKVNKYLQCPAKENVFVAGDQAWIFDKENGQPYPMRAQFAVREGKLAASNIARHIQGKPLREFSWKDTGFIVSLGKRGALAQVWGVKFSGPAAWILYRGAYLFNMVGLRTKLRTGAEWIINLFLPRDISKL